MSRWHGGGLGTHVDLGVGCAHLRHLAFETATDLPVLVTPLLS